MKKMLAAVLTTDLLASSVYAYSQDDRIKDMRTMADALSEV